MTDERNLSNVNEGASTSCSNYVTIEVTGAGNIHPEPISIQVDNQSRNYVIGSPLANYRISPPRVEKEENCCMYGLIPCLFVIAIGFIASIVAYLVFGIIYLVEDNSN